ncbi:MAG: metallophosphoesterase [Abditibacteriales bacterium]|nr:metallophosphoesterase [Abditibacteriales bacterium]MDW8367294.1 metallophosphoesterase [Abditibacteriales bacterium]
MLNLKCWLMIGLLVSAPAGADSWFFIATGDSHLGAARGEIFAQVVQDVNRRRPDFFVLLGDAVENALPQNFALLMEACEKLQVPLHYVVGNHDVLMPGQPHSRTNYLKIRAKISRDAPHDRTYYAFTHKNCRFIVLDTAGVRVGEWGVRVSDPQQWDWLESELKAAQGQFEHIFVLMHVPTRNPLAQLGTNRNHWFTDRQEADEFDDLMARYKVDLVLCAHDHMFEKHEKDGVTYVICGSAGGGIVAPSFLGGFHNYVEVHVSGKTVTIQVVPILRSLEIQVVGTAGTQGTTSQRPNVPTSSTRASLTVPVKLTARGTQPTGVTLPLFEPMALRWSSSNPNVGTVDAKGRFTARAPGKTKVTVTCGVLRAEVEVTVTAAK